MALHTDFSDMIKNFPKLSSLIIRSDWNVPVPLETSCMNYLRGQQYNISPITNPSTCLPAITCYCKQTISIDKSRKLCGYQTTLRDEVFGIVYLYTNTRD